ncbi:sensor histidine kinase KdpD [Colwellia sp. RSH04]|uniref:sensor histidine kinase n=1 Tax=Colwellia sp. RSH04 TaxID=2305464 RepID=UPI000E56888E|nr:HAMP domain-containing sensor histidine kinase [Colwellia sp. RSH04]RHW76280.1 sensor histidine kinase [Colwellia sp. RSH04]
MPKFISRANQIQAIIALRSVAITIQLLLIFFVNLVLQYELPWTPLFSVIGVEVLFTLISRAYYAKHQLRDDNSRQRAVLIQICADILFLSFLLFFSGGATNAFVSLLLIPIAIAAVTLTPILLAIVASLAIASYSALLWFLPMSVMHGNMEGHFIGMGINFLFSALVVALVVGKMARSINQQELAIAAYREDLLKQEQVTSLGVASAQVTHQLATPIATVQLLSDELAEDFPDNPVIEDMQIQLARCRDSLSEFREMVFSIKEQTIAPLSTQELIAQIKENIDVNYPEVILELNTKEQDNVLVKADAALLPAILNLINNAIRASKANSSQALSITSQLIDNNWQLIIRDYGSGFTLEKLSELGVRPVDSEQGLGMAVFLSHASLERLGGKLTLTNHQKGGALVTLSLPNIQTESL